MKKQILTAVALGVALGVSAQGLSMRDSFRLSAGERPAELLRRVGVPGQSELMTRALTADRPDMVSALVSLQPGMTAADLLAEPGVESVIPCRFGFAVVTMRKDNAGRVAASRALKSFSLERPVKMKLDEARLVSGINQVHEGTGLPRPYTGKGVVCGVIDTGLDPNHITFRNDDGSTRVSMFSHVYLRNQLPYFALYGDADKIDPSHYGSDIAFTTTAVRPVSEFKTDDTQNYHGTHTLGILAGSYKGPGEMAYYDHEGGTYVYGESTHTPFYGVATGAEIATGAGASTDVMIVLNLENILQYAYESGQKRSVINMSLGSNNGPHDGSNSLNQYMDMLCEKEVTIDGTTYPSDNAVICISAGNEGDMPIAFHSTLASKGATTGSFFFPMIADAVDESTGEKLQNMRAGSLEIYSSDERPFRLRVIAWNKERGKIAWQQVIDAGDGTMKYFYSDEGYSSYITGNYDEQFAKYFDGFIGLGGYVDTEVSGRYCTIVDVMTRDRIKDINDETKDGPNAEGKYILGFQVEHLGEGDAQRIDVFGEADGYMGFDSYGVSGFITPDGDGTISDMATGHNQIIVGSYNTREKWAALSGDVYGYDEGVIPVGDVSAFTSFGTLIDGRTVPHVVAPGATVVSASNSYFHTLENVDLSSNFNPLSPTVLQGRVKQENRTDYYLQMSGTSMATPLVAGSIATWLEADPTLDHNDILDIIRKTSVNDKATAAAPAAQVGAGKFDAYAGLKEVLRRAGVDDISADSPAKPLISSLDGRIYNIMLPGAGRLNVAVYNTLGAQAAAFTAQGDETDADLSSLAPGVYVLTVNGGNSLKITLK